MPRTNVNRVVSNNVRDTGCIFSRKFLSCFRELTCTIELASIQEFFFSIRINSVAAAECYLLLSVLSFRGRCCPAVTLFEASQRASCCTCDGISLLVFVVHRLYVTS